MNRIFGLVFLCAAIVSCGVPGSSDCYGGLELGGVYEIRVVEAWSESSQFRWDPVAGRIVAVAPRCDGSDGLHSSATFRIRLDARGYPSGAEGCQTYLGIPIEGISGVNFSNNPRMIEGVFGVQTTTSSGVYKLWAWTELANPVGVSAAPGEAPPLNLVREGTGCIDVFAVEMHRIAHAVDAGASDARGGDL